MRAVKIALYGLLVSGALSHVLVGELQKAFAGKTRRASKLGQIFASNLIISPIQAFYELYSFLLLKYSSVHAFLNRSSAQAPRRSSICRVDTCTWNMYYDDDAMATTVTQGR